MSTSQRLDTPTHAKQALEEVCARGDLERARELYADDFLDHVNDLGVRGQEGIAKSVVLYAAIFPDLEIRVDEQVTDHDQPLRERADRRGLDDVGRPQPAPPARRAAGAPARRALSDGAADRQLAKGQTMDPLSKRIVFSWIATDMVWCALLVYSLKQHQK